jgi:hypothetical protein
MQHQANFIFLTKNSSKYVFKQLWSHRRYHLRYKNQPGDLVIQHSVCLLCNTQILQHHLTADRDIFHTLMAEAFRFFFETIISAILLHFTSTTCQRHSRKVDNWRMELRKECLKNPKYVTSSDPNMYLPFPCD